MYYYIVNPNAGNGAINGIQDRLKKTLHGLRIDGEFAKTLAPGDAKKIALLALKKGVKTLVAVGDDATVNEIISAIHISQRHDVAVGVIPLGDVHFLANNLSVGNWREACEVLAARRLQEFQLITINDQVFLYSCYVTPEVTEDNTSGNFEYLVDIDGNYRISGTTSGITVSNIRLLDHSLNNKLLLDIQPPLQKSSWRRRLGKFSTDPTHTKVHAGSIDLECRTPAIVDLDGLKISDKRFKIALTNQPIKLITGHKDATGV